MNPELDWCEKFAEKSENIITRLDKLIINVTDEEIKNEKIKLIEKYQLDESIKNKK